MNKFRLTQFEKKIVYFKTVYHIETENDEDEVIEQFQELGDEMQGCVRLYEEVIEESYEGVYEEEIDQIDNE